MSKIQLQTSKNDDLRTIKVTFPVSFGDMTGYSVFVNYKNPDSSLKEIQLSNTDPVNRIFTITWTTGFLDNIGNYTLNLVALDASNKQLTLGTDGELRMKIKETNRP